MAETTTMDKGTDDNLMAAIAHAGILVLGVLLPVVIWLIKKEKSKYVAFQALQAAVYQLAVFVVFIGLWFVFMILAIFTGGLGGILMILLLPLVLIAVVYGLYGAYMCYQGKDFKYVLIGNMLAKR
jgi:uncharacterized Tic20 family protein